MRIGLFLLFSLLVTNAVAQTTVTIESTRDTTLFSENGNLSNGAGDSLFAGRVNNGSLRRALVAFDNLSAIPSGATVTQVELVMQMTRTRAGAVGVGLHAVTASWGEAGSDAAGLEGGGATAQNGDATWVMRRFPDQPWGQPGGDFDATAVTSESVGAPGEYVFGSSDAFVALVQDWIANPNDNHGVLLMAPETGAASAKRFSTREGTSIPRLRVTFTEAVAGGDPINPSGLWFDAGAPGDGFNVVYSANSDASQDDLLTIFFFGYTSTNQRLWLISDTLATPIIPGQTIRLGMLEGPNGGTGSFATPADSSQLSNWGTLDITFDSCTGGSYSLSGVDGTKASSIILLAPLAGLDCDPTGS